MKKIRFIYSLLCAIVLGACAVAGCGKIYDDEEPDDTRKGFLTIGFNINGSALTKVGVEGEDLNNENSIMEVDLYFYEDNAGKETAALYSYHENVDKGSEVSISFSALPDKMKEPGFKFKVIAVVNCGDELQKSYDKPTIKELEKFTTKVAVSGAEDSNHRTFRGVGAPQAFVMTNLTQSDNKNGGLEVDEENGTSAKISLKRLASKIRIALAIDESVSDNTGTWKPDTKNMRLYFSNGVRTARLDGDVSQLTLNDDPSNPENSDYFNISTTGNKVDEDSNYSYARPINSHDTNNLTGSEDKVYTYYNDVPHYSYPSTWTESLTEAHQPTLTIVIPWEKDENGTKTYEPTYYSVPVNNNGKLESNSYYYLRTHIGMKGSSTPEVPMPVDVETEILDWGKAEDTEVELKPIRFLLLNQTDFTIASETEKTVSFNSTHPCVISDCKIWVYGCNNPDEFGEEVVVVLDDNTLYKNTAIKGDLKTSNNHLYDYTINNKDNTFTFSHRLFEGLFYLHEIDNNTQLNQDFFNTTNNTYNETKTDNKGRTYVRKKSLVSDNKKLYTRFDVEITLRHSDRDNDTPYQEEIILRFYPSIYINSEKIEGSGLNTNDGWIMVNGYGTDEDDTGRLKQVSKNQGNRGDNRSLLTFTVTNLSEEDKDEWGWVIGDPRSTYINDELSTSSMNANQDNLKTWFDSSYGGPYDGTSNSGAELNRRGNYDTNRHKYGSGLMTMWQYYPAKGEPWTIPWSDGIWDVTQDYYSEDENEPQYHRTIKYYYPTMETSGYGNIIAPKYTIVSYHAYALHGNSGGGKEVARRRCAAYQQYGYPAGRWRLPTHAEIQFIKKLQKNGNILDVFGNLDNWSAQGRVDSNGTLGRDSGNAYTRCVYDNWYWEQVDANGTSYNRIPDEDGSHENWKKFHWGDRPKENPLNSTMSTAPTVENFIRKATQSK